jgi:hypothetical protein
MLGVSGDGFELLKLARSDRDNGGINRWVSGTASEVKQAMGSLQGMTFFDRVAPNENPAHCRDQNRITPHRPSIASNISTWPVRQFGHSIRTLPF